MRVIAGEWRGRRLAAPKGEATRPTADRTRETLFNMLASRIDFEGLRVADLFAGSGALGLEALSRRVGSCLFVEHDRSALEAIRANIEVLRARARTEVRGQSVMALAPASAPYDLILLDPPYDTGAAGVALDRLLRIGWIDEATTIAVETSAKEALKVAGLAAQAERTVGKAKLWILRKTS